MTGSNKPDQASGGKHQMVLTEQAATALQRLAKTTDQLKLGREVQRRQVLEARGAGASWASIGRMLGCSAQAAYTKYGPRRTRVAVPVEDALW
jgi:hypothetical protein